MFSAITSLRFSSLLNQAAPSAGVRFTAANDRFTRTVRFGEETTKVETKEVDSGGEDGQAAGMKNQGQ